MTDDTKNLPAKSAGPDDAQIPAYLKNYSVENDDNFGADDIVIPRIKLLQGLSNEIEMFDTAKAGLFWHTGLDEPLGAELVFAIAGRRKKYLLAKPLSDGGDILARADDAVNWDKEGSWSVKLKGLKNPVTWTIENLSVAESGLAAWGSSNPEDEDSPPAATLFYDYLVFLPERLDLGPAVITLARSQIRKAKKGLNDKIKLHQTNGRPMQSLLFMAKSVEEQGDEGPYKNWAFSGAGFVQDENFFKMLIEHKDALGQIKIQDEVDGDSEPDIVDDGEGNF